MSKIIIKEIENPIAVQSSNLQRKRSSVGFGNGAQNSAEEDTDKDFNRQR
jgi:hypothetical protein